MVELFCYAVLVSSERQRQPKTKQQQQKVTATNKRKRKVERNEKAQVRNTEPVMVGKTARLWFVLFQGFTLKRKPLTNSNSELRSCVKVEMDVLGSPSLIASPYGLCGRKAILSITTIVRKFRHLAV